MRTRLRRGHLVAALLGAVVAHLLLGSAFAARITHSPGRPPGSLFLTSGAVINFNAGDVTLTHAADTLAIEGGNVGIGTAAPGQRLHVQSPAGVESARFTDNSNSSFYITHPAANVVRLGVGGTTQDLRFGDRDGGTDAMTVKGTGNVGIGTTSPTAGALVVAGSSGAIVLESAANGAATGWKRATTTVNAAAGATITATDLIPAGSVVYSVVTRVTTAFGTTNGLTSISIGDGTDVDRWGATTAITLNATTDLTDITITSLPVYAAATSVVITGNGGTGFDATGVIRVTVFYMDSTAPTS